MSRCFVLEAVKQDITDCEEFGKIIYIFQKGEPCPSIFSSEFQNKLEQKFKDLAFNPEEDFFVLTGFQISLCLASSVLMKMFKSFDMLAFYAPTRNYASITVGEIGETVNQDSI